MEHRAPPVVLDIDHGTPAIPNEQRINLRDWEQAIRFGCTLRTYRRFAQTVNHALTGLAQPVGTVLMGSGDLHHVSHLLIERVALQYAQQGHQDGFTVVVLDNHPDNMRFPFGIHCGSWVKHVVQLPAVKRIHVIGITSGDVGARHAWENYWLPIYRGKVRNWILNVDTTWAKPWGLAHGFNSFGSMHALLDACLNELMQDASPVYLSIDKDVFSADIAKTNWDQGQMTVQDAARLITTLKPRLIGSDITGEVSVAHYDSAWKRWLSSMDDQPSIPTHTLATWQAQQGALNNSLLDLLGV